VQVFILFTELVTWDFPTSGLFPGQGGKTFESEHLKQSVVESQRVKSYRISRAASVSPCIFPEKDLCLRQVRKIL
jgi:hypothetical protein